MSTKVNTILIEPGVATTGQVLTYNATSNAWGPQDPVISIGDDCPIGSVVFFPTTNIPVGWLACDGADYLTTDEPELYALIGYTYGQNGLRFKVPDLRGEFIRCWDGPAVRGVDPGRTVGSPQADELRSHTHTYKTKSSTAPQTGSATQCWIGEATLNTGATGGLETRPRNIALLACIKARKTLPGTDRLANFIVKPTSPTNGQILSYSSSSNSWIAIAAPTGLPSVATGGQVLTYNGSTNTWVASASPASVKNTSSFTIDGSMLAKAWVNFKGDGSTGSCVIKSSYNVSSVVKTDTGKYTVTFTTPFDSVNYIVNGIAGGNTGGDNPSYNNTVSLNGTDALSAGSCNVWTDSGDGNAQDSEIVMLTVFASGGNLTGTANVFDSTPVGTVSYFAASAAPMGYMICNGSVLSRAAYPELFAVIGTIYNTGGEGVSNFRLPNLLGEFIRGWDNSRGVNPGRVFGSSEADAFQGHWHGVATQNTGTASNAAFVNGNGTWVTVDDINSPIRNAITDSVNGTPRTASETRPRNIALLPCIKVLRTVTGDTTIIDYISKPASASDGQVLSYNGTTGRWVAVNNTASLPSGTNGQVLTYDGSTSTWVASAAPISSSINAVTIAGSTVILQDQKSSGTSGGNSTSGTWTKRTLNTKVSDLGGLCELNNSQFSLLAGTYAIDASAPCYRGNQHRIRLFNVTDNIVTCYGSNEFAWAGTTSNVQTKSSIKHIFTISSTKTFEIQHYINTAETDGLGVALNQGTEIYTTVEITKSVGLSAGTPIVDSIPVGTVSWFAASAVPVSYLECNGSVVSVSAYPDLFAVISTRYNTGGEGLNRFRLPDLRGEFIRGWSNGKTGVDVGRQLGSFQPDEFKSHTHKAPTWNGVLGSVGQYELSTNSHTTGYDYGAQAAPTESTGGIETRPRNIALLPCIKAIKTLMGPTPLNFIEKPTNPRDGQTLVYKESTGQWEAGTSIGIGTVQTYQNVLASRAKNTIYTNNTSKPILVCISGGVSTGPSVNLTYTVDGVIIGDGAGDSTNGGANYPFSFIVPVGSTYSVGGTRNIGRWVELR